MIKVRPILLSILVSASITAAAFSQTENEKNKTLDPGAIVESLVEAEQVKRQFETVSIKGSWVRQEGDELENSQFVQFEYWEDRAGRKKYRVEEWKDAAGATELLWWDEWLKTENETIHSSPLKIREPLGKDFRIEDRPSNVMVHAVDRKFPYLDPLGLGEFSSELNRALKSGQQITSRETSVGEGPAVVLMWISQGEKSCEATVLLDSQPRIVMQECSLKSGQKYSTESVTYDNVNGRWIAKSSVFEVPLIIVRPENSQEETIPARFLKQTGIPRMRQEIHLDEVLFDDDGFDAEEIFRIAIPAGAHVWDTRSKSGSVIAEPITESSQFALLGAKSSSGAEQPGALEYASSLLKKPLDQQPVRASANEPSSYSWNFIVIMNVLIAAVAVVFLVMKKAR